ncbi:cell adhesion molecule CEACAM1-like isoform X2 [Brachyhypopomus gauderio]|uniref:cell adhesion molecule CEACAM1-like isoform X2 n=1 Tax=Brachyhypopomus gauderio TaxID=698409 RepID=UPI0040413E06
MQLKMNLIYTNLLLALTGAVPLVMADHSHMVEISGPDEVVAGVSALYQCSAVCRPSCIYTWTVEGQSIAGSTFTLTANGMNPIAVMPSTDQPLLNQTPKVGRSFHLTCNGAVPPVTIVWFKDGGVLSLDNRMTLSSDNATLTFSALEKGDGGQYECRVINGSVSVISRDYWINFDYVIVTLTGPDRAEVGVVNNFSCNAKCGVDCTVQWGLHAGFPKGKFIAEGTRIHWTPSEVGQTQVFTCIAMNPGAGKLGHMSKPVTVIEGQPRLLASNSMTAKSSVTVTISATLLMQISAFGLKGEL